MKRVGIPYRRVSVDPVSISERVALDGFLHGVVGVLLGYWDGSWSGIHANSVPH